MSLIPARKSTQTRLRISLIIALMLSVLFTFTASAAAGDPLVTAERLSGTQIGVKIEFPNEISGEFAGFMWGKYFDCNTISNRIVYCIGPLATWVKSGLFYLYSSDSKSIILVKLITVAQLRQEFIPTPQCPPRECD
jgi:hypothetical protein